MVYNCQLCIEGDGAQHSTTQFPSLDQLEAHLAAEHFGVLPYECEQCQFAKFPTEFAVIKHNEVDHGNRSYSFRCRITPEVKAKRHEVRLFLSNVKMESKNSSATGHSAQSLLRSQQPQKVALLSRGGLSMSLPKTHPPQNQQHHSTTNKFVATVVGQEDNLPTNPTIPFATIKKEMNDLDELPAEGRKEKNAKDGTKQQNDQSQRIEGESQTVEEHSSVGVDRNSAIGDEPPTSLTEQIQAACLQKIRREGAEGIAGATSSNELLRTATAYGGTLEIREGAELTVAALLNSGNAGDGSADDGLVEEMDDGQQADVQEILKAAAAAVSQVGGAHPNVHQQQPQHSTATFGRRVDLGANGGYSLRPNRFSPYALLHQGISSTQQFPPHVGRDSGGPLPAFSLFQGELKREKVVERIQCRKCKEMINAQGGCLNHHTNTRHLRLPMFQCTLCNKDFFEVSNTRIHKHMRLHHGGDTNHLVSNYHKYSSALHAARDECFGRKEERIYAMRNAPATVGGQRMDFNGSSSVGNVGGTSFGRLKRAPVTDACATVREVLRNHHEQWPLNTNVGTEMNSATTSIQSRPSQKQQRKTDQQQTMEQRNGEDKEGQGIGMVKGEEGTARETDQHRQQQNNSGIYIKDDLELNDESEYQQQMESLEPENEEDEQMEEEDEEEEEEDGCEGDDGPVHPMLAIMDAAFKGVDDDGNGRSLHSHQSQKNPATGRMDSAKASKTLVANCSADASSSSHRQSPGGGVRTAMLPNHLRPARPSNGGQQRFKHISYVGTDEKVPCKLCGEMVWNKITNRLNHINVRHLQLPLHECAICHKSFASYSRSACYSHVQFAHKPEIESGQCSSVIEEHIIYRKDCYNAHLMEAAAEYF